MSPHASLDDERPVDRARETFPSVDELPPYLGLGWLDGSTVRSDGDRVSAVYSHPDGLSYRVEWSPERCEIGEYQGDRRLSVSGGPSLQPAVLYHALFRIEGDQSPFWERVAQRLSRRAYVHRDGSGDVTMPFFPAFDLGWLRFIIPDEMRRQVADPDVIERIDSAITPRLGEWAASPGAIVRRWADRSTTTERVTLMEYIAPAIRLEELVVEPWEWGLSGQNREERIVAGSHWMARSPAHCYVGDPARSLVSYAIVKALEECPLDDGIAHVKKVLSRWRPG